MKKNIILIGIIIFLILITALIYWTNLTEKKQTILNQNSTIKKEETIKKSEIPSPPTIPSFEEFENNKQIENADLIVGDDKDEHGCIGSAGYVWCEEKQKCLREWEEECVEFSGSSQEIIAKILAQNHQKDLSEVSIKITQEEGGYVRGGVEFAPGGPGNAGMFLATKEKGGWEVVFDGNGNPDCLNLKQNYNFPEDILVGFCD
jgi:uncharacterized protein YxeA